MKEELCRAFCTDLRVEKVPAGLAVSHWSWDFGGDPICIYLIGPDQFGLWHIQDDGTTLPVVEATGADLTVPARAELLNSLLAAHLAHYDDASGEIMSRPMVKEALPKATLKFFGLLTRVQDLALTARDRVEAIWVQEVEAALRSTLPNDVLISKSAALSVELEDYPADLVIRAKQRLPVAVYFGLTDTRAYEALLLRTQAKYHYALDAPVILVLEKDDSITRKQRLRADANLIVPRYRGAERATIGRIIEEATGRRPDAFPLH